MIELLKFWYMILHDSFFLLTLSFGKHRSHFAICSHVLPLKRATCPREVAVIVMLPSAGRHLYHFKICNDSGLISISTIEIFGRDHLSAYTIVSLCLHPVSWLVLTAEYQFAYAPMRFFVYIGA